MKGLLYRRLNYYFRPVPIILIVLTLLINIYQPLPILFSNRGEASTIGDAFGYVFLNLIFYGIQLPFMLALFIWLSLSIIKKDEASKWNMFLDTSPVKKRTYITEIYIFAFVTILLFSLICSLNQIAYDLSYEIIGIKDFIQTTSLWVAALSILMSVILPVSLFYLFKKIPGKASLVMVFGFIIWLFFVMEFVNFLKLKKESIFSDPLVNALVVFAFSCGVLFLSWFISQKIYKKREF